MPNASVFPDLFGSAAEPDADSPFSRTLFHLAVGGDPDDLPPDYQHIVPQVQALLAPRPPLEPGLLGDVRHHLVEGRAVGAGEDPDIPPDSTAPVGALDASLPDLHFAPARGHQLGDLSMQSESGFGPGAEVQAAGRVSTGRLGSGKPDAGGVSYGAFQLSSKKGTLGAFLTSPEGRPWASELQDTDGTSADGRFAQAWKKVAARDGQAFFDAQKQFIKRTLYDPVVSAVARRTGLDINRRSPAVQDALWSAAVQHGQSRIWAPDVVRSTSSAVSPTNPDYDLALINNLYDKRLEINGRDADRYFWERGRAVKGLPDW
jgi:hypothetical protein